LAHRSSETHNLQSFIYLLHFVAGPDFCQHVRYVIRLSAQDARVITHIYCAWHIRVALSAHVRMLNVSLNDDFHL